METREIKTRHLGQEESKRKLKMIEEKVWIGAAIEMYRHFGPDHNF